MLDMTMQALRAHDYGGPDLRVLEQAPLIFFGAFVRAVLLYGMFSAVNVL